jgi:1,4-alpha-glucan branching enzyme
LLFMGEEDASRTPFLFFTDHRPALAEAVRDGRRSEFARFSAFADPQMRERIPDPNELHTFEASIPHADRQSGPARRALYRRLIALRHAEIVPRLDSARALDACALGPKAVAARWRLGGGVVLTIGTNLGTEPAAIPHPAGDLLFAAHDDAAQWARAGCLARHSTIAFLDRGSGGR